MTGLVTVTAAGVLAPSAAAADDPVVGEIGTVTFESVESLSVNAAGEPANGSVTVVQVTPDGRYVVAGSSASNLVEGDTNGSPDLFVLDRTDGSWTRINLDENGDQVTGSGGFPMVSDDAELAVITTTAALVTDDTNDDLDAYLRDLVTGEVTWITRDGGGTAGKIDGAGTRVVFSSSSSMVVDDTNGVSDVFVYDIATGVIERVSLRADGSESPEPSGSASISRDGSTVVFTADEDLVAGKTRSSDDIAHLRDLNTGELKIVSRLGDEPSGAFQPLVTDDGSMVAYTTSDPRRQSAWIYESEPDEITWKSSSYTGFGNVFRPLSMSGDGRYVSVLTIGLVPDPANFATLRFDRWTGQFDILGVDRDDGFVGPLRSPFEIHGDGSIFTFTETDDLGVSEAFLAVAADTGNCAGLVPTITGSGLIRGTDGDDVILGSPGDDHIIGLDGNDVICAGAGNDLIRGRRGNDTIFAGPGNDRAEGNSGNDVVIGSSGDDVVIGNTGDDHLIGSDGSDIHRGGPGADLLDAYSIDGYDGFGGAGLATFERIIGGRNSDTCIGSPAVMTFCETIDDGLG